MYNYISFNNHRERLQFCQIARRTHAFYHKTRIRCPKAMG